MWPVRILELFGGVGAPRCALRNMGVPTSSIDYVEIDEAAVRSYNAMFADRMAYGAQDVRGWTLRPDVLVHGSPCQDFSICGHQGPASGDGRAGRGAGADEGSGTRSSLMWETLRIVRSMGGWRPRLVIWENVKNVLSRYMRRSFDRYVAEMGRLGYESSHAVLDARRFGLPQARERVFTVSVLGGPAFDFGTIEETPMREIGEFLEDSAKVPRVYDVTQPSVRGAIGCSGLRRATVIGEHAYTITTRQDRTPAQVVDCGNGRYRYLTERECWRLQGYTDEDYERARGSQPRRGRYYTDLYRQAGNSMPVPVLEALFSAMLPDLLREA